MSANIRTSILVMESASTFPGPTNATVRKGSMEMPLMENAYLAGQQEQVG